MTIKMHVKAHIVTTPCVLDSRRSWQKHNNRAAFQSHVPTAHGDGARWSRQSRVTHWLRDGAQFGRPAGWRGKWGGRQTV